MNCKDIIEKEINNNNWEIVETNDEHKQYKFFKKELTTVYCQFSVLNKGCTIFEFLKDVESLNKWYPFIHSIEKKGETYSSSMLDFVTHVFFPYQFQYLTTIENTNYAIIIDGNPQIKIYIKEKGNESEINIIYTKNAFPNQIYSIILNFFNSLVYALNGDEQYKEMVKIEHVAFKRYNSAPLTKYIHESQRIRITSNDEGNEMFIQADIKVPLRPQTFGEMIMNKGSLISLISERIYLKELSLLKYTHVQFSPLIQPPLSMDLVKAIRTTPEWNSIVLKTVKPDECSYEHSNSIEFKESVITFGKSGEDDSRVRFSVILNIPIIYHFAIPLQEKFLSNLVAPILFFFASLSSLSSVQTPKVSIQDTNLPEMATIESMSSLLLNAITLAKTKQKKSTTLDSLPEPILLKIFSHVGIESIQNVQLLCKSFFSLINGNLASDTWKGIFNSTCYFNGRYEPEASKENLIEIAKQRQSWKIPEVRPVTHQYGEKSITAIDINGMIYVGNEDGDCNGIMKKSYDKKLSYKDSTPINGVKKIQNKLYISYVDGRVKIIENINTQEIKLKPELKSDFTNDGLKIFSWGNSIIQQDLTTGSVLNEYSPHKELITSCKELNGTLISSGVDKTIKLFDCRSNKIYSELIGQSNSIRGIDLMSDYQIVSCGDEKATILWDIRMNKQICKSDISVVPTCIAAFNRKVICGGTNGQIVLQWQKLNSLVEKRYVFKVQNQPVCVSLDDDCLVVGTNTGNVYFASF